MRFILRILLVFMICEFVYSMDTTDPPTERIVYNGFPVGIVCGDAFIQRIYQYLYYDENDMDPTDIEEVPEYEDEVQCVITKNNETVYNETISWQDSFKVGVFELAEHFWNGTKISVSSKWGVNFVSSKLIITVKDPVKHDYLTAKEYIFISKTITVGENKELICKAPYGMHMSESQYKSITTIWYQGDSKIEQNNPNFKYINVTFEAKVDGATEFDTLKINNASLKEAPGIFSCVLERDDKELVIDEHRICLKEPYRHANEPTIATSQENYKVEPGKSLTITCFGQTGTEPTALSQHVHWYKYDDTHDVWTQICWNKLAIPSENANCSSELHVNKEYCKALSEAEIALVKNHELNDNLSAEYTIWNSTESDSGSYKISLTTTRSTVSSNFTVVVEKNINDQQTNLVTIIIPIVAVVSLLLIITTTVLVVRKRNNKSTSPPTIRMSHNTAEPTENQGYATIDGAHSDISDIQQIPVSYSTGNSPEENLLPNAESPYTYKNC